MNFYLLSTTDDSPEEITADGYERDGDDWIFYLAGVEVVRMPMSSVVSIARSRL